MPLIPAHRRLLEWIPRSSTLLDTRDPVQRVRVLSAAWASSTLRTYSSGVLRWLLWCSAYCLETRRQFPISLIDLVDFVEQHAGSFAGGTIRNWVNGLRARHIIHGAMLDTKHPRLTIALRGADRLTPASSIRPPRPPFQLAHLRALRAQFTLTDFFDSAGWACLLVAFWGFARLGELVVPTEGETDLGGRPTRGHLKWKRVTGVMPVVIAGDLHLPRTKSSPRGEKLVIVPEDDAPCPVRALRHRLVKNRPATHEHLFGYRMQERFLPLTRSAFLNRLQRALTAAGLSTLNLRGHSLRIGGCTTLLLRGVPLDTIRLHGRWSSEAWRLYLRRHVELIAPLLLASNSRLSHTLHSLAAAAI